MLLDLILSFELGLASIIAFLFLRILPIWPVRHQGCDAYYFLLCIETFRERKRIPIILPGYYLLEPDEQWYPPGFIVLCALFPYRWLRKWYWLVNSILEIIPCIGLFMITDAFAGPWLAAFFVVLYGIQPAIIQEYASLTSRPLGALLQGAFLISAFMWVQGYSLAFVVALVVGALLIYSHKLSLQLLWFLVPFLSLISWDASWLWPFAGAYLLAFLIYPSLFIKVQRAHVDIVRFWLRNWPWLGAHAVRQSPIYGDGKTFSNHYKREKALGWFTFAKETFHQNYWVCFLAPGLIWYQMLPESARFAIWWAIGTYLWGTATYFIHPLRSLGLGRQYFKFAYLPVFFIAGVLLINISQIEPWLWGLSIVCLFLNLRNYFMVLRSYQTTGRGILQIGRIDTDLESIIGYFAQLDGVRLLVLPYYLADLIAYRTRKPVAWGTHGYGFQNIENLFPILREPMSEIISKNRISHLILDTNYIQLRELKDLPLGREHPFGHFVVYQIAGKAT